ncbi:hypothetical protein Xoosp13_305 [Xanthomonas phage Xoo-sp13]|nr:hypothetical protein Xoosp13_305 [Xanthomonas phage Xoo-sp13]
MKKPANLPYYFEWSQQYPHIAAVDLFGKNVANEIAVMAIDNRNGDLFFIRLDHLDPIDIKRLRQIILKRDSVRYALWDLMSQSTLPNGMNALEFFEQFVKIRTVGGQIVSRNSGERGLPINPEFGYKGPAAQGYSEGPVTDAPTSVHDVEYVERDETDTETDVPSPVAKRRAGRPRKA